MTAHTMIDLFCGTGALSYGIERGSSAFRLVAGIDNDPVACATARLNHPASHIVCGDLTSITPKRFADATSVPTVDLVVGGPPCQGFSSLRPYRSTNISDPRNNLYSHFASYVSYFEPKAFLMENVVGLVSHDGGRLLASILRRFRRLGYETQWRVLNCANYGLPQKRERFILLGARRAGKLHPDIRFPRPTHSFQGRVIGTRHKSHYVTNPVEGLPALTVCEAISDLPPLAAGEEARQYGTGPRNAYQKARRRGAPRTLSLHNATRHSDELLKVIRLAGTSRLALPPGTVSSGFSSTYSRLSPDEPSTTITVKFTSPASSRCIHPTQDRAISPREAARLQGFDDAFAFAGTRTQVAQQIGNAVPPLLGEVLATPLQELF